MPNNFYISLCDNITNACDQNTGNSCSPCSAVHPPVNNKRDIELFLYYCALILNYDLTTVDIEDGNGNLVYVEQDFKIGEYEKFIKKTQRLNHNG